MCDFDRLAVCYLCGCGLTVGLHQYAGEGLKTSRHSTHTVCLPVRDYSVQSQTVVHLLASCFFAAKTITVI